jgi:hypothetical protein
MYDIEVIDGSNYAVISEGSPAYEFLKVMNSRLVMKKLASEPGQELFLTVREVAPICRGFRITELRRLEKIGLIKSGIDWNWSDDAPKPISMETYTFTPYGLDIMRHIKENGGDVEIEI